jgi:hypothetical protein
MYYVWGDINNAVYVPLLDTPLPELAGRERNAVAAVTLDLLNMWTEIEYRYSICWATHSALVGHL